MNSYVIILSLDKVPYIPVGSIQYVFFTNSIQHEHGFQSTVPCLFTNKYVGPGCPSPGILVAAVW